MSKLLIVNPGMVPGSSESSPAADAAPEVPVVEGPAVEPLESLFFATIKPEEWIWDEKNEQWYCTKALEDENGTPIKERCISLELELDEEETNNLINHMPEILIDTTEMSDEELEKFGYTRHEAAPMNEFLEWAMGSRELYEQFYDYISRNCLITMTSYDRIARFNIMKGFNKLDKPVAVKISQIAMTTVGE